MRVQTEEWRRFIPGMRMYRGKMTLFYNGEKLSDVEDDDFFIYDYEEKQSWEVIIVLPGVEVIPEHTFCNFHNVEAVIMNDSVKVIHDDAFNNCKSLSYVRLSRNLEYIGAWAFNRTSLYSIFIPPSCREIGNWAFQGCEKLIILQVSQQTELGQNVIRRTALIDKSPFTSTINGSYENTDEVNHWIKNRHQDNEFSLHRACSSYDPLNEVIYDIVRRQGLKAFKKIDSFGVTPSQYLSENPIADIEEKKIIKRYILDMMGEVI